jgi:hypothetical protein
LTCSSSYKSDWKTGQNPKPSGLNPLKKTNIGQRYILNQIDQGLKREVFDF